MITEEPISRKKTGRKLRVVWLTSSPTPYKLPFFSQLSRRDDISLHFIFLTWNSATRDWSLNRRESGISHEVLPGVNLRTSLSQRSYMRWNPSLITSLDRQRCDVVVISGYNHPTMLRAIFYCRRRGIPFVLQGESHVVKDRGGLKKGFKRSLLYPILRNASAALATGAMAREYWKEIGIPEDRIFTVGNLPDVSFFKERSDASRSCRDHLRAKLGIADDRPCGIFVGRFIRVKGVDILLQGLAETAPARRPHLLLAGDGPMRPQLEALVKRYDLPVTFLGFRQKDELPELYSAADFFALPSRDEPWGVVVNEAQICRLPVLLSDRVGAAYDLLQDGDNGYMVRPNTPSSWRFALERIASRTSGDLQQMGERSREIALPWNYDQSETEFVQAVHLAAGTDNVRHQ